MKERTSEDDISNLVNNGTVVLIHGIHKYIKHEQAIIPVSQCEDGRNIIRTVLSRDMDVYEIK